MLLGQLSSSFRDPAGYVFSEDGLCKRAVTQTGRADYDLVISSGLYDELVRQNLLVAHLEERPPETDLYKVLIPQQIRHISYPYEWSFEQLKDAALLTLRVQKIALAHGMSLKDASAYNVQFIGPQPVFIDTLSFEKNPAGPWVAYGQFCNHFLAPLLLMQHLAPNVNQFLKASLDGFPLDLASRALPLSTWFRFGPLVHLHLHARSQKRHASERPVAVETGAAATADRKALIADSLESTIASLRLPKTKSEWIDYYAEARHYAEQAQQFKREEVSRVLEDVQPRIVYDLGGNTGEFSRLATRDGIDCICFDIDPLCVNRNYVRSREEGDRHMLPLLMDFSNPSPAAGFGLGERLSLLERRKPDLVLALAVLHHLRITANIPLARIAKFLSTLTNRWLLIEFVPKSDSMVEKMLKGRKDIFTDYSLDEFLGIFGEQFALERSRKIPGTERTLCLFRR